MSVVEQHIDECDSCRALLAGIVKSEVSHAWYPGQRIDRYVLVAPIGRGGMGAVWRADDLELERPVALKRLHAGGRDRLFREARTLAQLQHPNVVGVYEVVDHPDAPFLAMELVDGVTLTTWLETERTWREIVAVVAQAGRGLAAAHARGLVHRDFKPDNVLVDNSGDRRVRVADFGLASIDDTFVAANADCKATRVTVTAAGTPAYMAPELIEGAPPDVRSDVYAFAITLFEALHGEHPFEGKNVRALWLEMAAGHVRDGKRRIPAWLDRCVRRGLAVDPDERWPDIATFVAALERRPRRRLALAAGMVAACAATAGAAYTMTPAAVDECAAGADLVGDAWNPMLRATTVAQLATSSRDLNPATATANIIDHWAGSWKLGRRAACSAGERRPARIACLDRELSELRSLLETWSSGAGIERAVSAAAALPASTACNSAADSPLIAQPLIVRIIEAKTLWRTGRSAQALPNVPALLRDAEAIGHHDTLAQALLIASYIEHDTGTDTEATAHARRAAAEASKSGDHALLYSALVQQAYQRIDEGAPADALGILDAAEALSARGVPNPEQVIIARGGALMRLGRTTEAITHYDKAIALLEANSLRDPTAKIAMGVALAGRGNAYLDGRNAGRGILDQKRALALQESSYGPRHPEVARTLYDIAQSEIDMQLLDDASAHLARAREIFVGAYGEQHPEVGQVDVARATNAKRQGHIDEARAMFEMARKELSAALRPDHMLFSVIENQLGSLEQIADNCRAAIPHLEKGRKILLANNAGGDEIAHTDVALADCLLDIGNHIDAKTRAEEALDQLSRAGLDNSHRAVPLMLLAMVAEKRGQRDKAIGYAKQVIEVTSDTDIGSRGEARTRMRAKLRAWGVR